MITIALILKITAIVLWTLAAAGVPAGRVNLTAAGLACWFVTLLIAL